MSEEGGDGKGAGSEAPSLLTYTLRYVSLAELGKRRSNFFFALIVFSFFVLFNVLTSIHDVCLVSGSESG